MRFVSLLPSSESRPLEGERSAPSQEGRLGVLHPDGLRVLDVARLERSDLPATCMGLLSDSAYSLERLSDAVDTADALFWVELDGFQLGPPLLRPGKIMAMGLNYREHAEEQNLAPPEMPVMFAKFPSAIVGPEAPIVIPPLSDKIDYEVELAAVVGRRGRMIASSEAAAHIFGYTVVNDVTARDLQRTDRQWVRAKSFDTFCPMGPCLVTADEFDTPPAVGIRLRVNGEERQSSNTSRMTYGPLALVTHLSQAFTLEPGDVISTGTPSGVGVFRDPPVYLRPGDVVEAEIDGIGTLRNPIRAWGG
jgi:2-keto-4-pentenoate hydratase/2-oxohepta-3-ene-1,7-dioic acid hydratase in catechol pathway